MALMVAAGAGSAVSLPIGAASSSKALVAPTAPSSLLAIAALGNRRPSLRSKTTGRVLSRNWGNSEVVKPISGQHECGVRASLETTSSDNQFEDDVELNNRRTFLFSNELLTLAAAMTPLLLDAENANAAGGEFGILEGRIFSLVHPLVMISLFLATGYAGYLGWQWRRVRTIQDEINVLKKQVPATVEGQTAPSSVESQIKELTETRKALVKGGFRDRHFNLGSILLGAGVLFSVSGAVNTYLRAGKLFPGPHLYAGVGITVLWALAAALVPAMQKGNDTARSLHIAFNTVNLLLFVWQIPTGLEIVLKVLEFTKFP